MARRRRKHGSGDQGDASQADQPAKAVPAPAATTSLGSLLKAAHVSVAKPPAPAKSAKITQAASPRAHVAHVSHATTDGSPANELRMLNDAYSGARPLTQKKPGRYVVEQRPVQRRTSDADRAEELAARKRLAELVSGGVHFKVKREDEYVLAFRNESGRKLVEKLGGQGFAPEATLDLHGMRTAGLSDQVSTFVRSHHRRGARHLLFIVGKGLHSEDGVGVLLPALIEALTQGLCAPLVRGFATANARHGGTGAVAVLLI